jgi:hypothetical protein
MDGLHSWLLSAHSIVRWFVLVFGVVAVGYGLVGWLGKRTWSEGDARYGRWFSITVDIQALLGLVLYFTAGWFGHMLESGVTRQLRFFAIEHLIMMLIALVLVHVGVISVRRAESDAGKHRRATIWFGLSLLVILMAIPWPWLEYGRDLLRLPGVG